MRLAAVCVPLALLAGCSNPNDSVDQDAQIDVRGDSQNALFDLSDMNRDIAMRRAITGAGLTCDRVTGSGYASQYESLDMWVASCEDGREWAVFTAADDSAQVRLCSDVVEEGIGECTVTDKATGIYAENSGEAEALVNQG